MMGGSKKIMKAARKLHANGEYLAASEILDKLVFAEPQNQPAKDMLADVYEQLGYQQENPGLRNAFLSGAYELRSGIPEGASPSTTGPDLIRAMSTELFLDFLGIRMDGRKVEGLAFKINLITPDTKQKYLIELSNSALTNIEGYQANDAALTLTINRSDLEQVMMGTRSLVAQIEDGTAKADGDLGVLKQLAMAMVDFEIGFEVLPGTKSTQTKNDLNDFEVGPLSPQSE
jgi:alkyl sulfatase BDS1-like metallo-beta-lactamase superfamily hydrolase